MGETPRRSGFRLPWGDSTDASPATPETGEAAVDEAAAGSSTPPGAQVAAAAAGSEASPSGGSPAPAAEQSESSQFLRELVDAMRGVAESSRDTNLADLRTSLDQRVEELRAAAAQRAEELRLRSEQDITSVGDWERAEIERIRTEAEQRRDARRAKLDSELTEHQAAADREVEETRRKLTDYERELGAFFAELAEIQDPAAFVAAAKRMPPPPDLGARPGSGAPAVAPATPASGNGTEMAGEAASAPVADDSLAQRLAQLDKRLAGSETGATVAVADDQPADEQPADEQPADEQPAHDAPSIDDPAMSDAPAATATAEPVTEPHDAASANGETSTPIVVKGLGSFGAITSFKQALERVDGVRGVTLSLGPTGEFVYRASHGAEFDIIGAIRSIEGQAAGIEESEGSVLVTIERQR